MEENNRFTNSNFREVFGELENVYRLERSKAEIILIPGVLFFLLAFGVITYVANRDLWTIPCCIVVPLLLFSLVVWQFISTRKDELRIYENGFTYRAAKNLQSCLWTEITTYHHRERNNREITEPAGDVFPLGAVEKKNGERIDFDHDLPGTPDIIARFEKSKTKAKPNLKN
jgi:hypothetical protein